MIALNDNTLFVGQIKQILHDFNLPNCGVGFKNPAPNRHFIANGYINLWKEIVDPVTGEVSYEYEKICPYKYNKKYDNLTTNLPVRNLLYDRETHRYLGNYLRFLRDFRGVDLMCMYNCFDGEIFEGDVAVKRRIGQTTADAVRFKHGNNGTSIFAIPVDFQKLTIRVSSESTIHVCLCIDTVDMSRSSTEAALNQELMDVTLTKFHANEVINYDPAALIMRKLSNLSNPSAASIVNIDTMFEFIAKNIKNLKLLLRITRKNAVNITVLEGIYSINYTLTNNYFLMRPLRDSYVPLLFPREAITDSTQPASLPRTLDVDGYPLDNYNSNGYGSTFSPQYNDVRFALTQASGSVSSLYEIILVKYYVDATMDVSNPRHFMESGFDILPQLLQQNDVMSQQYLLADRLMEYLSGNVICPLSEPYDIRRLQVCYAKNNLDVFNRQVADQHYIYGIWSPLDLYNTRRLIADNYNKIDNIYDMLGYADKEIEKLLGDKLDVN